MRLYAVVVHDLVQTLNPKAHLLVHLFPPLPCFRLSFRKSYLHLYLDISYSLGHLTNARIGYFISKFPYPYSKKITFTLTTEVNNTREIRRLNANCHNVACLLLYYRNQKIKKTKIVLKGKKYSSNKTLMIRYSIVGNLKG